MVTETTSCFFSLGTAHEVMDHFFFSLLNKCPQAQLIYPAVLLPAPTAGRGRLGFVRAAFLASAEPEPAAPLALIEGEAVQIKARVKVKSLPVSSSEHKSYGPIGHSPLYHCIDWGATLRSGRRQYFTQLPAVSGPALRH